MQEEHIGIIQEFPDFLARIKEQQKKQSDQISAKTQLYQNFYEDKINDFLDEFANVILEHQNNMASIRQDIIELQQLFLQVKQDQKMLKEALRINTENSLMNRQFLQTSQKYSASTKEQIKNRQKKIHEFQTKKSQQGKKSKTMFYKKGSKTSVDKQKSQLCITISLEEKRNGKKGKQKVQYYFKYNKNFNRLELIGQGSKQLTKLLGQFNCNRNIRELQESLRQYTEQISQNRSQN